MALSTKARTSGESECIRRASLKAFARRPCTLCVTVGKMRRIIVGISGASGSAYGYMTLQALRSIGGVETHLVLTTAARRTIELEMDMTGDDFEALADVVHRDDDLAAAISSGSFLTDGMLVIPCSMKSASAIAYSMNANLLVRAADVCLKERRRVVLVVRET